MKYANSVWDTLPSASDYYLNASTVFEMEGVSTKLAYANNSLYLFYAENSTLRIKKYSNNQWSDIGNSSGYNVSFSFYDVVKAYNNQIVISGTNYVAKVDLLTENVNITNDTSTGDRNYFVHKNYAYIIEGRYLKSSTNNSIQIVRFDAMNNQFDTLFHNTNSFFQNIEQTTGQFSFNYKITTNAAGDVYVLLEKYTKLPTGVIVNKSYSNGANLFLYKLENNQLNLIDSTSLNGIFYPNGQSFAIADNNQFVYAYLSTSYELNVVGFNGSNWYGVGNQGFCQKAGMVYKILFNNANEPYIAFEELNNWSPIVAFLNKTISVSEPEVSSFSVFPNPSNGVFNIHTSDNAENISYQIYALDGKKMAEKTNVSTPFSVDISKASNGVYILKVLNGGKTSSIKLLKLNE